MKLILRDWNWWAYFFRVRHRSGLPGIEQQDRELMDFAVDVLAVPAGGRILDVASGCGSHARILSRRGFEMVGLEIAPSLVEHARQRAAEENLGAEFVQGDMRELAFDCGFEAVTCLSSSFGFFDDETNAATLRRMARALKPGGRILLDLNSAEQAVHHTGARWQELDGGYLLMRSAFDPLRGRLTNEFRYVDSGGALNLFDSGTDPATESIRLYSAPEIEALFRSSDLLLVGIYGSLRLPPEPYRTGSSRYLAVGEKPGRL